MTTRRRSYSRSAPGSSSSSTCRTRRRASRRFSCCTRCCRRPGSVRAALRNDPQLIIETMQAGAREFLPRPVSARTLSLAFGRYLDEKQRHRTERDARQALLRHLRQGRFRGHIGCHEPGHHGGGNARVTRVALVDLEQPGRRRRGLSECEDAILGLRCAGGGAASRSGAPRHLHEQGARHLPAGGTQEVPVRSRGRFSGAGEAAAGHRPDLHACFHRCAVVARTGTTSR